MTLRIIATGAALLLGLGLAVATTAEPPAGDFARGAKVYSDNCARCHNARPPFEHRDREWSMVMTHMRIIAGLPGDQARDVEAFLRRANDPPRPPVD